MYRIYPIIKTSWFFRNFPSLFFRKNLTFEICPFAENHPPAPWIEAHILDISDIRKPIHQIPIKQILVDWPLNSISYIKFLLLCNFTSIISEPLTAFVLCELKLSCFRRFIFLEPKQWIAGAGVGSDFLVDLPRTRKYLSARRTDCTLRSKPSFCKSMVPIINLTRPPGDIP